MNDIQKDLDQLAQNDSMILRSENLVKKYGKRTVVNGVSFEVHQGEIVGLLGQTEQVKPHLST